MHDRCINFQLLDVIGVIVGKGFIKDQNNAKLIELVLEDDE